MAAKRLVVLTGAGISKESGLTTFRESGGLWETYRIEDVASISGWHKNPRLVLEFYNKRREQACKAKPNPAHLALAELQNIADVHIITQNVDDLHERAGSKNVLHLHGKLTQARSVADESHIIEWGCKPMEIGQFAPDGHQVRPHIVWFGETVPNMEKATEIVHSADAMLIVGTSLQVYPAAGLAHIAPDFIPKCIIDPDDIRDTASPEWKYIREPAGTGTKKAISYLLESLK